MTQENQENKELLLKDLCARLSYGIYVYHEDYCEDNPEKLDTIYYDSQLGDYGFQCCVDDMDEGYHSIEKIKPYLRPMSSMTKEEAKEIAILHGLKNILSVKITDEYIDVIIDDEFSSTERITLWYDELISSIECFDWLNAHHFDFRNLIGKGLALEAPEGMYEISK